jgi:hypothetical protein
MSSCRRLIDGQWIYLKAVDKNSQVAAASSARAKWDIVGGQLLRIPALSSFKEIPLLLQERPEAITVS